MPTLTYHRPKTLPAALDLLQQPNSRLLAGGTQLTAQIKQGLIEHVIDLQAVGLDQISTQADTITLGSMVTLQAMVDSSNLPDFLRQLAQAEAASTFRHIATVGGTIMAYDAESELVAGLLVCEAQVTVQMDSGEQTVSLAEFLRVPTAPAIITHITLANGGTFAHARVARTPKDKPIVAAVARKTDRGTMIALCGVATTVILVQPDTLDKLTPEADFRGSSSYRLAMADVLTKRVIAKLS